MNSVYSRRIEVSQPACIVSLTTGSFTGRALVTTSCVPEGVRSTATRPNRTCGMPSASAPRRRELEAFGRNVLPVRERHRDDDAQRLSESRTAA